MSAPSHLPAAGAAARGALLALFTVSGFCALVYEAIWAQYLKLLLGHAALAQTLVLVIFMGGMALGSWLAARRTLRWRNLLLVFAVVEGAIGLAGVGFHGLFGQASALAHDSIMPALAASGGGALVEIFKWGLAASLVLPQSVLLGMSFPLLSAAMLRRYPQRGGDTIATLYFTNSLGAAAGVLASGFALVPALGLPGTVLTAGLINVALALVVWLMAKGAAWQRAEEERVPTAEHTPAARGGAPLLLAVALATGLASFIYEIGWIRMLSLVLGASTHAFELMLSAFILGLALGSLWVRRRVDALGDPGVFLGVVQIVMGVLALGTLLVYGSTFELMAAVLQALERNDGGYLLFNLASHGIAMLVMLPVTFCAGMTLPLITAALLRAGHGERSIGQVYAANTLGAIAGVALAVHVLMPLVGLKGLICAGAAVDMLAGAALLLRARPGAAPLAHAWLWPAAGLAALVLTVSLVRLDVYRMSSGVFRYGHLDTVAGARVVLHEDGKTATVSLVEFPVGIVAIMTNGKTDGSIQMRPESPEVSGDELTMTLLGALALGAHPGARSAAVVGFGTGMSSHTLLGSDTIERIDTIEIEPRMVEAARVFHPRVARAFDDPRSRIHYADARTYFATSGRRYDLIVSEPSNPWVSGIATLFTGEFYQRARRSLAPGGRFVQWIHVSEISIPLISSIVRGLGDAFPDYALYNLNGSDLMIIAGGPGEVRADPAAVLAMPGLRADLARIDVHVPRDLDLRYLGSRGTLEPLLLSYPTPANSDYFPVLDLGAVRARYLREDARALLELRNGTLPLVEMLDPGLADRPGAPLSDAPHFEQGQAARAARRFAATLGTPSAQWRDDLPEALGTLRVQAALLWPTCGDDGYAEPWRASMRDAREVVSLLDRGEVATLVSALLADDCTGRWTPAQARQVALLDAVGARDAAAMVEHARAALEEPGVVDAGVRRDLLAALLLGLLAQGDARAAVQADQRHAQGALLLETDIEVRLLRLLAHARAASG